MTCFDVIDCDYRDIDGLIETNERGYRGDYIDCMPFYIEEENYQVGIAEEESELDQDQEEVGITEEIPEGDSSLPIWLIALIAGVVIFCIALIVYFKVKTYKSIRKPKKEAEPNEEKPDEVDEEKQPELKPSNSLKSFDIKNKSKAKDL